MFIREACRGTMGGPDQADADNKPDRRDQTVKPAAGKRDHGARKDGADTQSVEGSRPSAPAKSLRPQAPGALSACGPSTRRQSNFAFHHAVASASGNESFADMLEVLHGTISQSMGVAL